MGLTIAFCTAATPFHKNQILDEDIAKIYPGALAITKLAEFSRSRGIEVMTGDIAMEKIKEGLLAPSDILVIQEENYPLGFELIGLGAKAFLLVCAESPLYARNFYAHLHQISEPFKNRLLFRGTFSRTSLHGVNHVLHFASFSQSDKTEMFAWSSRRFMVMVAANKYWKPRRATLRQILAGIRDVILRRKSYITPETQQFQLHDKRLGLIEYFGQRRSLDLFGAHWEDINNLPREWRGRLQEIVDVLKPTPCSDKHDVMSRYKFAICFENMSFPGYVTEKIIHCFSAGVIPIYLGAPDICDFVPKETFIDLRQFDDLDVLNQYLTEMTEKDGLAMIAAGREFLSSKAGAEYSYEGFAESVLNMVDAYE